MEDFDDAINDIGTALMRLRSAFAKHHLPAPDGLEWTDPRKGREVEILLREHMHRSGNYVMQGGQTKRETTLAGFTMRYAADAREDFNPYAYTVLKGMPR